MTTTKPQKRELRLSQHQPALTDVGLLASSERQAVSIGSFKQAAKHHHPVLPLLSVRHRKRFEGICEDGHKYGESFLLAMIDLYRERLEEISRQQVIRLDDPLTSGQHDDVAWLDQYQGQVPGEINFLLGVYDVYESRWRYLTERARR